MAINENPKSANKTNKTAKAIQQQENATTIKTQNPPTESTINNNKTEIKPEEKKTEAKKEEKKPETKIKKDYALANALNLSMSPKYSKYICNMIRGKDIESAQKMLEEVIAMKRVVKMHGLQVPHKHGKGVMAGRYPITAAGEFLILIKQLRANAMHNELEIEKYIVACKANVASKPYRRGGARFKRTHITLRLEKNLKAENKKQNENKNIKSKEEEKKNG